jgi:hypothetical protein
MLAAVVPAKGLPRNRALIPDGRGRVSYPPAVAYTAATSKSGVRAPLDERIVDTLLDAAVAVLTTIAAYRSTAPDGPPPCTILAPENIMKK